MLKDLGWKLLLQIHDEVILEGPKESRDAAMAEVRHCMENPFDNHGLSKLRGMRHSHHHHHSSHMRSLFFFWLLILLLTLTARFCFS